MHEARGGIPLPPHAYIPGKTPRHPEGWFDAITTAVPVGGPLAQLHLTQAWTAGLLYLERGYFWECHEVLEAVWMQAPQGSPEREMVQAVIQLANARLKLLMERPHATIRLCTMVQDHLASCPLEGSILGLTAQEVGNWCAETELVAKNTEKY